jgi:maleate isomerase
MAAELPAAASLLPNSFTYQAVGYGCTSGTAVIGADQISLLVQQGCTTTAVSNPLTALIAGCKELGIQRLAFLSPYLESVSDHLRARIHEAGIETPIFGTFNEEVEANVVRISADAIIKAAVQLGQQSECDGIFLSCTNLRTLDVIADIEKRINKPVLSSNQVLAWHLAKLAGVSLPHHGYGRLISES